MKSSKMLPVMEIVLPQIASNVPAFLGKLWKMVDDPDTDYLISWSDEGNSFIIHSQAEFAQALLPYYYKHSNMASFVRQLNMYGFHKVVGVDSGGLKSERQEEMEFAHPCFLRGNEHMLDQIRRKVASKQSTTSFIPSIRQEKVTEVLSEVSQLRDKQEDMDTKLDAMKKENEALWREVVSLRQKHTSQQKIVNKLIHFLMSVVQPPRMSNAVKRRYQAQLAIGDAADQASGLSSAKLSRKENPVFDASQENNGINFGSGPIIQDVTHDDELGSAASLFFQTSEPETPVQPRVETPMSPLSAAVLQAVDPMLVSPAITIHGKGDSQEENNRNGNGSNMNINTFNNSINTTHNSNVNDRNKMSTVMITPQRKNILQREISKEDFDFETNLMQKDLDNLKEMLSGQITFDSNILSNLFNPDEPLASYFSSSNSNPNFNDFGTHKLQLELEASAGSNTDSGMMDQPSLFELADIDEVEADVSNSKRDEETVTSLIDLDDDFSASLNTPQVIFDSDDNPLLGQIRTGRKTYKK